MRQVGIYLSHRQARGLWETFQELKEAGKEVDAELEEQVRTAMNYFEMFDHMYLDKEGAVK